MTRQHTQHAPDTTAHEPADEPAHDSQPDSSHEGSYVRGSLACVARTYGLSGQAPVQRREDPRLRGSLSYIAQTYGIQRRAAGEPGAGADAEQVARAGVEGAVSFQRPGPSDDVHERHADEVADAVVAGESAEPLLDRMGGESGERAAGEPSTHAVQMKGDRSVQGPPGDKGDKGEPGLNMDPYYLTEFNSAYNLAVNTWGFMSQMQQLGIDSIYTEAKKPAKPDLEQELLVSLAIAALGGTVSVIGLKIARSIENRVTAELTNRIIFDARMGGGGRWVRLLEGGRRRILSNEEVEWIKGTAGVTAKYLGELGKDAFKDGLKSLTGPKIRALLQGGKAPIDAFFEGQKSASVEAAKGASDALEGRRAATLRDPDPLISAEALHDANDAHFKEAEAIQKDETLRAWLQYQARSRLGEVATGKKNAQGEAEQVSKLQGNLPGQVGGIVPDGLAGVVTVDLYPGAKLEHKIMGGALPGLSRAMLRQLEAKPLKQLGLPIVFRIVADPGAYERAMRGIAPRPLRAGLGPGAPTESSQFTVRVDEAGRVFNGARHPHHHELLARWVAGDPSSPAEVQRGAESIGYLAYVLTLKDLGVQPDKE